MTGTRGDLRFKGDCPECKRKRKITFDVWFPQPGNAGWWRASKCYGCGLRALSGPLTTGSRRVRWTPPAR